MDQIKFLLIVTEAVGWYLNDAPESKAQGANRRRAVRVGKTVYAYDIFSFDGVPYAYVVPENPAAPEWGRVGEKGSVIFDDDGHFVSQVKEIRSFVKVVPLVTWRIRSERKRHRQSKEKKWQKYYLVRSL